MPQEIEKEIEDVELKTNEGDEVVPKSLYEKTRQDMLDYKKQLQEMKTTIDAMKVNTHKEKEDWKTVAELSEKTAKELEQKYSGLKQSLIDEKKMAALTVEAQKQGINPASIPDLNMIDFDELIVETTSTGKILVSGQDKAIARLKTQRPHWFSKSVPNVNTNTPETGKPKSGTVTVADLNAAEAQYRKTKSEADKKAYSDLIQKYKAQRGS